MKYKGYEGIVEFDDEAGVFTGEVINTRDVITFQAKSVAELRRAFRESVDDYLAFCQSRKESPDKPFSGAVLVRMSPELHRQLALEARRRRTSLNRYITERLQATAVAAG